MLKTHLQAIENLKAGKAGRVGRRDRVSVLESIRLWEYHDSVIVQVNSGGIWVNWHGWFTVSTTARIYALCDYLRISRIKKADGSIKLIINDKAVQDEFCGGTNET